jgi:hypothetical protein
MRKTILATAIGILALTGCATSKDYQIYAQTQQQIATARAEAEIARYETLRSIANSGDTTARVAAVIALQQGASSNNNSPRIEQPTSVGDTVLKWTSVLLPSLTQFYSIGKSTDLAIVNSNNNKEIAINSNETMLGFGKLIVDPIVGTQEDVLLYPR